MQFEGSLHSDRETHARGRFGKRPLEKFKPEQRQGCFHSPQLQPTFSEGCCFGRRRGRAAGGCKGFEAIYVNHYGAVWLCAASNCGREFLPQPPGNFLKDSQQQSMLAI